MVQRNTDNYICRECGQPLHRGMTANRPRRKRVRWLVRPGEKAKRAIAASRDGQPEGKATADEA